MAHLAPRASHPAPGACYNPVMPKVGTSVEQSGIYWCSVCKFPVRMEQGATFPVCQNKCGRGTWELVRLAGQDGDAK